jgi:predicted dehydrogenase
MSDCPPLRVVQVGAGGMGRAWLATVAADPEVQLVGLVDLDTAVAGAAAAETGFAELPIATSLGDLLEAGVAVDAVINVTVPRAHHPVNTAALSAGLPVLCEKPLAESVSECLSMVAAAELSGRLLMVSQSRRYWRAVTALRDQLDELGPVASASCRFFKAPHFGGFRESMPYPLLVDMAIHQFDLARHLIGAEPTSVFCRSYNPSWSWYAGDAAGSVIFEFGDDATFTFDGSWCAPGLETSWNGDWRFGTSQGTVAWDGDNAPVAETGDGQVSTAALPDEPEQIAGSLTEFVRVLREGGVPNGEVHSNVLSVAMVEAAVQSAETGKAVSIAAVIEAGHAQALANEQDAAVREVLAAWPSVLETVGLPAQSVQDGGLPALTPAGTGEV